MAECRYWLGDASDTTAVVVVQSDTVGTVTITCNGQQQSVAVDPAVEFGVQRLPAITGLTANTKYPFTLTGIQSVSGTLRTMPVSGVWKFGWESCVLKERVQVQNYQMVMDHNICAYFAIGDVPYCDEDIASASPGSVAQTRWKLGAAINGVYKTWNAGRASWDATYDNFARNPGFQYVTQRVPMYRLPDDHEYGNDWDWSANNVANFTPAISLQSDIDICGGYANQASWTWTKGNPINTDPEIGNWKPSSCADAASNHPPKYYRKTIGQCEFFHLDCFAHMDSDTKRDTNRTVCINNATWNTALGYTYSDPAGAALARTRLGPYQLNWLLTHLAASTAKFKVIVSGKNTFQANATSNNKGWYGWSEERNYILSFIERYVTGVLWIAGDVHTASVINQIAGHACVNSSPAGQANWIDGSGAVVYQPGYTEGMIYRANGAAGTQGRGLNPNSYGIVEVTDNYLHPVIYNVNGTLLWEGYLMAGENFLRPTPVKYGQMLSN